MDYILPATCTDTEFRQMWQDFEWENKVSVNTTITDLHEYLRHLLKSTNMKCLTPEQALSGQCGFMAANMYARWVTKTNQTNKIVKTINISSFRSIFGEDALANLSIENSLDSKGVVTGHIRIRAKSQVNAFYISQIIVDFHTLLDCLFTFQGMALSLGDKISNSQKTTHKVAAA